MALNPAARILGSSRHIFNHINALDHVGQLHLQTFRLACSGQPTNPQIIESSAQALLGWLEHQPWKDAVKTQFRSEVVNLARTSTSFALQLGVKATQLVEAPDALSPEVTEAIWRVLKSHLGGLARDNMIAARAYQRVHELLGPMDDGWQRLIRIFAESDPQELEAAGKLLRELRGGVVKPATEALQSARGFQSRVKGLLGEIYLPRWPVFLRRIDDAYDNAHLLANSLPGEWEVVHAIGDIKIGTKDFYDQAILLVNWKTGEAYVHTAVQVKMEKYDISVVSQIINDISRESAATAGKLLGDLPQLQFMFNGKPQALKMLPPKEGMPIDRLVYFSGPGFSGPQIKMLEALGVQVEAIPIDIPMAQMDELSIEILLAAGKLVSGQ